MNLISTAEDEKEINNINKRKTKSTKKTMKRTKGNKRKRFLHEDTKKSTFVKFEVLLKKCFVEKANITQVNLYR